MTVSTANHQFTAKHARLIQVAKITNYLAGFVVLFHVFLVASSITNAEQAYMFQNQGYGQPADFYQMLGNDLVYAITFITDLVSIFLRGAVYGLLLKGISLGLKMLVEIDINIKEKSQGGSHE